MAPPPYEYYYWQCRDCERKWESGQAGVIGEPNSGWYVHEASTGHIVDPVNGKFPEKG